jgi:hypothetical protein
VSSPSTFRSNHACLIVVNMVSNRVVRLLGKDEAVRWLNVSLYQGAPSKKKFTTLVGPYNLVVANGIDLELLRRWQLRPTPSWLKRRPETPSFFVRATSVNASTCSLVLNREEP